ncbi:hypothetical protein [Helicobacter sp. MIT 99-5507]|uniref:hypothetical protein n=1 Tax=Helicobacter sp. MIT 99-5507 TaxID=152489 RepID=UPI000E1F6B1A|nr:hypothetical protein [Helicobacter sp. MIT 99-5507]RDU57515.1 hypothetical protein CQA42_06245 [Helicobacter sp. MIT 99-5507]
MTKQKNEFIFSLIFFFFSSFFFLSIISSLFIDNFVDLLDIFLRPNNIFVQLSRILLFIAICILIYLIQSSIRKDSKKYIYMALFGIFIFLSLLIISFALPQDNLDGFLDVYDLDDNHLVINSIEELIIDSFVFIYFITIPLFIFFYKKNLFNNYFYKTYIKEIMPSLNVSIIFLFGYCIRVYDFDNFLSAIDFVLSLASIILFARIIFSLKSSITFYNIVNLFILIFGFILFILCSHLLEQFYLYYANLFFYTIGLLYWFFNILIEKA